MQIRRLTLQQRALDNGGELLDKRLIEEQRATIAELQKIIKEQDRILEDLHVRNSAMSRVLLAVMYKGDMHNLSADDRFGKIKTTVEKNLTKNTYVFSITVPEELLY